MKQGDKVEEQKGKKYKQSAKEGKAQVRSVQCKGCTEQVMILSVLKKARFSFQLFSVQLTLETGKA